jgi:hypothetical protein
MSSSQESFFEELADVCEEATPALVAPPPLKSKVYSALVRRQSESGPLLSISETKAKGRTLCVFENLVEITPVNEKIKALNFCRVCHARILAEKVENAPIYWRNCPYAGFHNH